MKVKTILFILAALCLTMSCAKDYSKDDPKKEIFDGHFECRGVHYETLQDAVDACVASGSFPEITLIGNVKDDGAVIPDGIDDYFVLNLSAFNYFLNEGKCLNIGNNDAVLLAEGGRIEGDGIIISSTGEELSFSDNIIVIGGIRASSDVCFEDNFLGKFEGNLFLDEGTAYFGSEYGEIRILDLTTKGSDAGIQVYNAPKGGIRIDNVISDAKYPVCAMKEGLVEIKSGAAPHVHKFTKSNEEEADCCTHSHYTMSCSDCGKQEIVYAEDEEEYGPCNPKNLVYEAALAPTATELGNTERWVCLFCGKAYADKDGKTLLEDGGILLPTSLMLDYDILDYFGRTKSDLFQPANVDPATIFSIIMSFVALFQSTGMSIPGLLPGSTQLADLNAKIDAMNKKLDEINLKIKAITSKIDAQQAKNLINDRHNNLMKLNKYTPLVFKNMSSIASSNDPDTTKIRKIKDVITWWSRQDNGKYPGLSEDLLRQYYSAALFGGSTVPKMFEKASNTVFLWEHDSYDFRDLCNLRDIMITCCSAILDLIYVSDIKDYAGNKQLRDDDFQRIKNDFKLYGKELERDINLMNSRKDKVRRLNVPFNVEFSNEIVWVDPYCWFLGNWDKLDNGNYVCRLPRHSDYQKISIKTCNTVKNSSMYGMPFTDEMAKTIYNYYSRNGKKDLDFKKILVDSAKFTPVKQPNYLYDYSRDDSYIVTNNNDTNFGHFNNGDVSQPYYNIFYWRAYRCAGATDWLGLRTCLDKQANTIQKTILPNCSIQTYSTGNIKKLGNPPGKTFWTLKLANN